MKVKELIKELKKLDQDAVIDISSDEEGNNFGDIGEGVAESRLRSTGEKVYSLYPQNCEMPNDRYLDEDEK